MTKQIYSLLLLLCVLGTACEVGTEKKKAVAATPVPQPEPSLPAFTDSLQKLDIQVAAAIEHAVSLYDGLAPHDSTGADSAASALMGFINRVVKKENDSLVESGADFSALLNPGGAVFTDRQKAVMTSLHVNRLKLVSDGEGGVSVVPSYETILPTVKARTSAAVDSYLDLAAKEDTTPVFRDAGLAVELPELADRLVLSEELTKASLPKMFAAEAVRLNRYYTHALVNGADNSPSVDYNTTALNEEFRKAYDYLLAKYPSSKAAANINVWLAVVASGDKKKMDAYRTTMQ